MKTREQHIEYYRNDIKKSEAQIEQCEKDIVIQSDLRNKTPHGFNAADVHNMFDSFIALLTSNIESEKSNIIFCLEQLKKLEA